MGTEVDAVKYFLIEVCEKRSFCKNVWKRREGNNAVWDARREKEHIILHILLGPEMQEWYDLEDTEIKRLTTSWIAGIDLLTSAYMVGGGWFCVCKGIRAQCYDNGLQML